MLKIAKEAHESPQLLKEAPHNTPVGRLDEVKAAKELVLCCWMPEALIRKGVSVIYRNLCLYSNLSVFSLNFID